MPQGPGQEPDGPPPRWLQVLILTERLAEVLGEFGRIKKARFRQEAQRYSRRRASRPVVRSPGGSTAANTSEAAAQPQFLDRSAEGVPQEKLAMLQAENDALVQELMSRSRQVWQPRGGAGVG